LWGSVVLYIKNSFILAFVCIGPVLSIYGCQIGFIIYPMCVILRFLDTLKSVLYIICHIYTLLVLFIIIVNNYSICHL